METSFKSQGEDLLATFHDTSSVGVVLCPPHPLFGASRNDIRLTHIARDLSSNGISTLRFDYGSYGKGIKEVQNVIDAVSFLQKRVHSMGLLGYSFGAVAASNAAAVVRIDGFVAMSILPRVDGLVTNLSFDCPKLFVHGRRDKMASYSDFENIYAEALGRKKKLVLDTDHFFMDEYPAIIDLAAKEICKFFKDVLFR